MITAAAAQQLVLDSLGSSEDRFCVQSCNLSPKADYWVVTANSEDYVLRGRTERCYVGVSAHLVDAVTGASEIVGSGAGWGQYLQDKYDLEAAGDGHYVLVPTFDIDDRHAVINLRQRLDSPLQVVRAMLSKDRAWLTGKLRVLNTAKKLLDEQGIGTTIRLESNPANAIHVGEGLWHWDALKKVLQGLGG